MNDNRISRRAALKFGVLGTAGAVATTAFSRAAYAAPEKAPKKLLLINIRGGWDGLHIVIPNGIDPASQPYDPEYSQARRPTLHIDFATGATIESGNDFCTMHPALAAPINGGVGPMLSSGHLVFLHSVGLWSRTGSHFEDQRTAETGIQPGTAPAGVDGEEGWAARALAGGFEGISKSTNLQQLFQTSDRTRVLPHVRSILEEDNATPRFTLATNVQDGSYLGQPLGSGPGYGLRGHYESGSTTVSDLRLFNRSVGDNMMKAEQEVAAAIAGVPGGVYAPAGGAQYPLAPAITLNPTGPYPAPGEVGLPNVSWLRQFMTDIRDAMWLLRHSSARVVGVELGGWDTHVGQGTLTGRMPGLLEALAFGLRSIYVDSVAANLDLTTLCFSEFGRTTDENGGKGTDHGAGSVAIAMGTDVNLNGSSRVYGCDATTWPGAASATNGPGNLGLTTPVTNGTFVSPQLNLLGLFAKLMEVKLGMNSSQIAAAMPSFTPAMAAPNFVV